MEALRESSHTHTKMRTLPFEVLLTSSLRQAPPLALLTVTALLAPLRLLPLPLWDPLLQVVPLLVPWMFSWLMLGLPLVPPRWMLLVLRVRDRPFRLAGRKKMPTGCNEQNTQRQEEEENVD